MSALIEISGDWNGVTATAYIEKRFMTDNKGIDIDSVINSGYDLLINADGFTSIHLKVERAPLSDNRNFIFVWIKDPYKDFDLSKVTCNVPIEVKRTHNLFGWLIYGVRRTLNFCKSLIVKK